ncbi:hypothetical protein BKA65DRAFT_259425 [Rhexocercosporidium sp. MPI-PUGE-AT-0058]|nr:hypothetical protein BKA65DRAFT_259425 [Rhexocercosporidium sp. MPI-PUGE-AT-0058]
MAPKTVSVSVKYSKPGTQPPIYLAGSFSEPAWEPQEMQYTTDASNEHEFFKEVDVEQGKEYQYKFRIGPGDWWILNEDSPTGTDNAGNRNNVLTVPLTNDTTASKPTEGNLEEASIEMQKSSEHNLPLGARDPTPEPMEEAMGTRETSDVLFSDEIIKDMEEPKEISLPKDRELLKPLEPHPTPAVGAEKTNFDDLVADLTDVKEDHTEAGNFADEGIEHVAAPTPVVSLGGSLPTPPLEVEKPHTEHIEENTKDDVAEPLHVPTVVVEKVDEGLSYGDDFGPDGTVAQKDAHDMRAQDAEPDQTVIRDAHTPDFADVAAEVADTAQTLDREDPTPPISDEDAGHIGYRRMSNPPIPEIAETAAEVADVATSSDKQDLGDLLEARGYFAIMNDESIVFPETPPHEKVPLFPHERGESPSRSESRRNQPVDIPRRASRQEEPAVYDPNDPTIQAFPEDREAIMRHLTLMQQRLPPDTADCVGSVDSAIFEEVHSPGKPVSPILHFQDQSPSLDSITEEHDEEQQLLSNGENVIGLTSLSEAEEVDEDKFKQSQVHVSGVNEKTEEPLQAEKEVTPVPAILGQGENAKPEPETEVEYTEPVPTSTLPDIEPFLTKPIDRSLDGAEGGRGDLVEAGSSADIPVVVAVERIEPNLTHSTDRSLDGSEDMPLSISPNRIPATPFVVGNRQLGHEQDDDDVQNITTPAGLSIQVRPATPRGSAGESDFGKTTAFEDKNGNSQIKSRKRPASPPDRPLTPSSIRGREQSKNFLKAFWRVVFVEWIGGLIMRLCNGGRSRQT